MHGRQQQCTHGNITMTLTNHQFRLAARPAGMPKNSDWKFTEELVREPGPGEVLVRILYVSLDPAMRG
jgi:NADPH-dependent curcumin reductase CurA